MTQNPRHIVISDEEHALPYSKGLMASSIMATGLPPARAFHVAERIEERLHGRGMASITRAELSELASQVLVEEVGQRYADSFAKWQVVNQIDRPLIILIGGATGVGKSTVATQLAGRLGITRIIPTDAIREVMRSMFSEELMPTLHTSSFDADHLVRHPLPRNADPVIIGYREQSQAVAVGAEALIRRAVAENTDLILEGAHLVPGFVDPAEFKDAFVVQFVIAVDDEEAHRSHFLARAHDNRSRAVRPVPRVLRQHPQDPALREVAGPRAQRAHRPLLQPRRDPCPGHRAGGEPGDAGHSERGPGPKHLEASARRTNDR